MENNCSFLSPGAMAFSGTAQRYLQFTLEKQLLSPETWASFVQVFREDSDDADQGWRCEYWGKMMRGACLCYRATGSELLYGILRDTVVELLSVQRPDGRFSTYSAEAQLQGWDLWGRKYVMTGLIHFLEICGETALRDRILSALVRHADAIVAAVGPETDQKPITETSDYWGGVNSCSILEPFMALYQRTEEPRYLRFAEYILSTGGCRDGNLIQLALEDTLAPYEYPEVKAYETISFFEGVLAYYEATGREEYLRAVLNFWNAVIRTDLTVIGCCGCTHELFDHSAVRQAEALQGIMQETCVTVTWMRLCARLLMLTGDSRYYASLERSGYNALYGAVNLDSQPLFDLRTKARLHPLPFDSYSPLTGGRRGQGVGGLKYFAFGGFYGCCACIAAAGIALLPLTAVLRTGDGICVNALFSGTVSFRTGEGKHVQLIAESSYPQEGRMRLTVQTEEGLTPFTLRIRVPEELSEANILINGEPFEKPKPEKGYVCLNRHFYSGDQIEISGKIPLIRETVGDSVAFRYGCVVLARDEAKEPDFDRPVSLPEDPVSWRMLPPEQGEAVRIQVRQDAGLPPLLLTDYASCGKQWARDKNRVTVWMRKG